MSLQKASAASEEAYMDDAEDGLMGRASGAPRETALARARKPNAPGGDPAAFPGKPELPRFEIARDRLLEYTVTLSYRTDDVTRSRGELYKIVSKYGYLVNSSTASHERDAVNASFRVKIEHLHEVIDRLQVIGDLESESITAVDHTENMVLQNRKARREATRSARRKNAPATAKTWAQKEQLISAGEDRLDEAEHEKWKIRDRVAWANFSVQLIGPESPAPVKVPRFSNAFVGMVNLLLSTLYGLIVISPLLLIAGAVFVLVRYIRARRKSGA